MNRRNFIELGAILAASSLPINAYSKKSLLSNTETQKKQIDFIYDGETLSSKGYSELLMRLVDEGKIKQDDYSNGGVVENLENKFASLLGKESAVFMPTGTLANHIAVRELSGKRKRVVVQEQSHLYNDSGDCCQTLSGLNLIPLGKNSETFSLNDLIEAHSQTNSGRVETSIGTVLIESPVRRQNDTIFGFDNIKSISEYARNNEIKMHMDGARLFVESVHTGKSPADYGSMFDTVYTSMYKCFNAPSGAILAGDRKFTEKLFHTRRMFGGGLPAIWPFAAIALHYADSFQIDYSKAIQNAKTFFNLLKKDGRFTISEFTNGTHVFKLGVTHFDLNGFKDKLAKDNIILRSPDKSGFKIKINPTINRLAPNELAAKFIESLN